MTNETLPVVVDGQAVTVRDNRKPAEIIAEATERADAVARIIESRKVYNVISGKKHVRVEGWTTLAAMYRMVPSIDWSRPVEGGGWEARAVLVNMDGQAVAHAEAECGTAGDGDWRTRASYAQRSMAETRAASKVCRLALSWVMVLAGFEATPAEEMVAEARQERQGAPQRPQQAAAVERPAPPAGEEHEDGLRNHISDPRGNEGQHTNKARADLRKGIEGHFDQPANAAAWVNSHIPLAIDGDKILYGQVSFKECQQLLGLLATMQGEQAKADPPGEGAAQAALT